MPFRYDKIIDFRWPKVSNRVGCSAFSLARAGRSCYFVLLLKGLCDGITENRIAITQQAAEKKRTNFTHFRATLISVKLDVFQQLNVQDESLQVIRPTVETQQTLTREARHATLMSSLLLGCYKCHDWGDAICY